MSWFRRFLESSVGSKVLMALTGIVLLGFIVGHLFGNLLIFLGPDALNSYAAKLKAIPTLVWTTRIVLLVSIVLHVGTATRLELANRAARPEDYAFTATVKASLASRTMMWTGAVILAYVIYHLLHFTFGVTDPDAFKLTEHLGESERHDVYGMVVHSFNNSLIVVIAYVIANAMLAWHLSHGIASFFQSLGLHDERYSPLIQRGGLALSALIGAGFISIPVSIRLGLIQ